MVQTLLIDNRRSGSGNAERRSRRGAHQEVVGRPGATGQRGAALCSDDVAETAGRWPGLQLLAADDGAEDVVGDHVLPVLDHLVGRAQPGSSGPTRRRAGAGRTPRRPGFNAFRPGEDRVSKPAEGMSTA